MLATWEPGSLPELSAAVASDDLDAIGLGVEPRQYAQRWDPRELDGQLDYGWIGEDSGGVWLRRHPVAALAQTPVLWGVTTEWSAGRQDVGALDSDLRTRSAWELAAHQELQAAHAREQTRRIRERHGDT